jgi:RNA polymerase sigma factor (sigma-70 family)
VGVKLERHVRPARRSDPLAMAALLSSLAPWVGRISGAIALDDGDDAIADVLRQLHPQGRAVLVLRDLEGFSEAETAALLRVERGTVKSRLHRARRAFRRGWSR